MTKIERLEQKRARLQRKWDRLERKYARLKTDKNADACIAAGLELIPVLARLAVARGADPELIEMKLMERANELERKLIIARGVGPSTALN